LQDFHDNQTLSYQTSCCKHFWHHRQTTTLNMVQSTSHLMLSFTLQQPRHVTNSPTWHVMSTQSPLSIRSLMLLQPLQKSILVVCHLNTCSYLADKF